MITSCTLCPRHCHAERGEEQTGGFCASPSVAHIARAALHFGEEPCIGGRRGAGAIFFTGCNLRCVFCQNREISRAAVGEAVSVPRLRELMLRLRDEGAECIDLVTATHYTPAVAEALSGLSLGIPVVWNSSGYESVETLKMLEGLVQVYMPDFKYWYSESARRFSRAEDYPELARVAIHEMFRQRGECIMNESGQLASGLLIRHLILPGHKEEAMDIIDFVADEFPNGSVLFSLMSQYTPMPGLQDYPELGCTVDSETNEALIHYMKIRRLNGYWQETSSAVSDMIPDFDGTGLHF